MDRIKTGDWVEYRGEEWEVGFINQTKWKGTLRLQKSGEAGAKQINCVDPDGVCIINRKKPKGGKGRLI
jgi:hypothetical protein